MIFLCFYYCFLRYLPASYFPVVGPIAKVLRYHCCKHIFKKCGKNVNIEKGAHFGSGFNIEIGKNSGIGIFCKIPSDTSIGENVLMGPNLYVFRRNHEFTKKDLLIRQQGYQKPKKTYIEDDVWIGSNCVFTPGRTISKGCVIAANSVVTKDFEEYSVIGGNPAKLIKKRN